MSRNTRSLLCLAIALGVAPALWASDAPPMALIKHIPLGGTGGWDYLTMDAAHHHLFVSHGDRVVVVDTVQDKAIGEIADTAGVHGIAVAPTLGQGFTSNGASNSVTVFDLSTLKTLATITGTGANPDAIVYDDASHHLFTFNGKGHSASVIDPATRAVVGTIGMPGKPEFAQADGNGHIFVNIEDTAELVEIDSLHSSIVRKWSLAPCESPSGLALDKTHQRLFSVCDNQLMVVSDADAGRVVAKIAIGEGPDAVVYDDTSHSIYSSNGQSGNVTVIHQTDADHYRLASTVTTQPGARTEALDPLTQRLYLSAGKRSSAKDSLGHAMTMPNTFEVLVVGQH